MPYTRQQNKLFHAACAGKKTKFKGSKAEACKMAHEGVKKAKKK